MMAPAMVSASSAAVSAWPRRACGLPDVVADHLGARRDADAPLALSGRREDGRARRLFRSSPTGEVVHLDLSPSNVYVLMSVVASRVVSVQERERQDEAARQDEEQLNSSCMRASSSSSNRLETIVKRRGISTEGVCRCDVSVQEGERQDEAARQDKERAGERELQDEAA
jgi:hypothetical protein